ncbi:hypothetical protein [Nocardia brasiliensis]
MEPAQRNRLFGPDPDRPCLRIRLRGSTTSQTDTEFLYRGRGQALSCP